MQKLWNGAQAAGEHKRASAHSWSIMPCKQQECEQRNCAFPAQQPWRKHFHTSLFVTKWATVKLKMIKFILKFQQAQWCSISTDRGPTCWLKGNGQVAFMQIPLHAFCTSVKLSIHYRYASFSHLCPFTYVVLQTLTWISSMGIALV